jgi:hypothetical protein
VAGAQAYVRGVVLVLVWLSGSYYVAVQDGGGEQGLADTSFPDVTCSGACSVVKDYGSDNVLKQVT